MLFMNNRGIIKSCGKVRGLEQRFESRVLPMFARRTAEVNKLSPRLYLYGLALGDFDLAPREFLGEEARWSATGTEWSPSIGSRRSTGSTSGRPWSYDI